MERKPQFKDCIVWASGETLAEVSSVTLEGNLNSFNLEVEVFNRYSSKLIGFDYEADFFDSIGTVINADEPYKVSSKDISVEPMSKGIASLIDIANIYPQSRFACVKPKTMHFEDGKTFSFEEGDMDKITLEKLSRGDAHILSELAGEDAVNLPVQAEHLWRCICGHFNANDADVCTVCSRLKGTVMTDYANMDVIKQKLDEKLNAQFEEVSEAVGDVKLKDAPEIPIIAAETRKISIPKYLSKLGASFIILNLLSGSFVIAALIMLFRNILQI